MTIKQSSEASPKEILRARKLYLLDLVGLITDKQKRLGTVQTRSVQAIKAEITRIDGQLQKRA
jgi:hypothetical protein